MDDEINGASGNQSPELLAVVGSEALDFAHCETEDVDLDFGDDLEAEEEAEQAAVGSASSFGYRESNFSSNNSTPSKHSRMPTERQSHIARSPQISRSQQPGRHTDQRQPSAHERKAVTDGLAPRAAAGSKRALSWQAAMGSNEEQATREKAATRTTTVAANGKLRKERSAPGWPKVADGTGLHSTKTSPRKTSDVGTHGSSKGKNPVARYLRQRLMGTTDSQKESQKKSPTEAVPHTSPPSNIPCSAAASKRSAGHKQASTKPDRKKQPSLSTTDDGGLTTQLPPPPPLPMPPPRKGTSDRQPPQGSTRPKPSQRARRSCSPAHSSPRQQRSPSPTQPESKDAVAIIVTRSKSPLPHGSSSTSKEAGQTVVLTSSTPAPKAHDGVPKTTDNSKAKEARDPSPKPVSTAPSAPSKNNDETVADSKKSTTAAATTETAAVTPAPEPQFCIIEDVESALSIWDQAPISPGRQLLVPPATVGLALSKAAAPQQQPWAESSGMPLKHGFHTDPTPASQLPRRSTQRWVDDHSGIGADRELDRQPDSLPLPPQLPHQPVSSHGKYRGQMRLTDQLKNDALHRLETRNADPHRHQHARSPGDMQQPWPRQRIGTESDRGKPEINNSWQPTARPVNTFADAAERVHGTRHDEMLTQRHRKSHWRLPATPFEPLDPTLGFSGDRQMHSRTGDDNGYPQPVKPFNIGEQRQMQWRRHEPLPSVPVRSAERRPLSRREEEQLRHEQLQQQWQSPERLGSGRDRQPTSLPDRLLSRRKPQQQQQQDLDGFQRQPVNSLDRPLSRRKEEHLQQQQERQWQQEQEGQHWDAPRHSFGFEDQPTRGTDSWQHDEAPPTMLPTYRDALDEYAPDPAYTRMQQHWQSPIGQGLSRGGPLGRELSEHDQLQRLKDPQPQRFGRHDSDRDRRNSNRQPLHVLGYKTSQTTPGRPYGRQLESDSWQSASNVGNQSGSRGRRESPPLSDWQTPPQRQGPFQSRAPYSSRSELSPGWNPAGPQQGDSKRRGARWADEEQQPAWHSAPGMHVRGEYPHGREAAHNGEATNRTEYDPHPADLRHPDWADLQGVHRPPDRHWEGQTASAPRFSSRPGAYYSRTPPPKRLHDREELQDGRPSKRRAAAVMLPLSPVREAHTPGRTDAQAIVTLGPKSTVSTVTKRRTAKTPTAPASGMRRGDGRKCGFGGSPPPPAWLRRTPPLAARRHMTPVRQRSPMTRPGPDRAQHRHHPGNAPPRHR